MAGAGIIEGETGAQKLLGYVLDVGRGDGRARCHLTVTADHTNRHGMLHGGIVATILDNAMGATGSLSRDPEGRYPFLTISLNTQYLAPAREGEALMAVGRITGGGRKLLFIKGELHGPGDRLVATATGVFKPVSQTPREDRP
ncbi:PaaI family thioesterase [Limimaricola litoreus]|uniref:PaaI family thioesterase n=1 Tax=Limimaricola litoreus TaxID=2955316 RepID=A0A9X2FNI4_9RHOB|nr:PaaI family thioesterase [Limimaricola litoreus]MCP1168191.1 PaaI family thioesterase [Limimaricola litoreus]